ncbi:sigma-54 interaction domain-containing protein [Candidatus Zixiibacteriota bacterium]
MKTDPTQPLSTILDSIADGVFTVDENWRITSFNRAAESITGVSKDEAIGRPCYEVFRADICQTACALRGTMETNQQIIDLRIDVLNSQGKKIPISISTAVLRDEEGNIVGGVETFRDLSTIEELRKEITKRYTFMDIISKNHKIQEIFAILPDIAESDSTVLIQGPSGSGKELFARAIHDLSFRKDGPYVVVGCGALPDTLLESELFGYVKGAFTDARGDKPGRFALAQGGTIFLDEIGDVSAAMQVKLLRVLQEREYEPLGAVAPVKADVRIITATNRDLAKLVQAGEFRQDLYYRLNVVKIDLPLLRQRREDIPLLVERFIASFNLKKGKHISGVSPEVLRLLMSHDFPGNVRELENIIEHAFVLCRAKQIELEHLPEDLTRDFQRAKQGAEQAGDPLKDSEARAIRETLSRCDGHRGRTAQALGIHPSTLWRKMKRLGIEEI